MYRIFFFAIATLCAALVVATQTAHADNCAMPRQTSIGCSESIQGPTPQPNPGSHRVHPAPELQCRQERAPETFFVCLQEVPKPLPTPPGAPQRLEVHAGVTIPTGATIDGPSTIRAIIQLLEKIRAQSGHSGEVYCCKVGFDPNNPPLQVDETRMFSQFFGICTIELPRT